MIKFNFVLLACILLVLTSCAHDENKISKPKIVKAFDVLGDGMGENELDYQKYANGRFSVGKVYKINGKKYQPEIDIDYAEVGYASWYGPNFHGKKMADGSVYDQYEYTAAHRTLPLSSVARVTNLENHRSVLVVIKDRGPFHETHGHKRRIIDVSKKAAQELGMMHKGLAKVRVEYLHEETKQLLAEYPFEEQQKAALAFQAAYTKMLAELNHNAKHSSKGSKKS